MEANPCGYAEVIPYFVISPEDENFSDLINITQGYNRALIQNEPFGRKKNEGLNRACCLEWDYLMELNSDTVYTSCLWDYHKPYFENKEAAFGFKNIYIYEPYLNRAVFAEGYHIGHRDTVTALGPGRCIRRDVVENCLPLWEDLAPFGMDGYSDQRLFSNGYEVTLIDNGSDPVICDVKGTVCLTCWMQWEECGVEADVDFVRQAFGLNPAGCIDLGNFDKFHTAVLKVSADMKKPDAFNLINEAYRMQTGEQRYSSYSSYQVTVSKKHKNK
jgi:hypothetical protein